MIDFLARFKGRGDLLEYAKASGIPISASTAHPYSEDDNMFHISHESGILEDPSAAAPEDVYSWTKDPVHGALDKPALVTIDFVVRTHHHFSLFHLSHRSGIRLRSLCLFFSLRLKIIT
jgi:hypothetical protein